MKTLFLIAAFSFTNTGWAKTGTEGHGGDDIGLEFQQAFASMLIEAQKRPEFNAMIAAQDLKKS